MATAIWINTASCIPSSRNRCQCRIVDATSVWIDVASRFPSYRNRCGSGGTKAVRIDMAPRLVPKALEECPGTAQEGSLGVRGPGTLRPWAGRGPGSGEKGGQQEEDGNFAESGHGRLPGDRSGTASMDARADLR